MMIDVNILKKRKMEGHGKTCLVPTLVVMEQFAKKFSWSKKNSLYE